MKQSAAVAFSASPLVGFGALQMLGTGAAPQWSGIVDDFLSPRFWLTILIMLVGGAFGGMAYELLLRGGARSPSPERRGRCVPGSIPRSTNSMPMV